MSTVWSYSQSRAWFFLTHGVILSYLLSINWYLVLWRGRFLYIWRECQWLWSHSVYVQFSIKLRKASEKIPKISKTARRKFTSRVLDGTVPKQAQLGSRRSGRLWTLVSRLAQHYSVGYCLNTGLNWKNDQYCSLVTVFVSSTLYIICNLFTPGLNIHGMHLRKCISFMGRHYHEPLSSFACAPLCLLASSLHQSLDKTLYVSGI